MVQKPFAGRHQEVVYVWVYDLFKGAVALDAELEVGSVAANEVDLRGWQLVAAKFVNLSFDGLYDFRVLEAVNVVPAFAVAPVAGEKSSVSGTFKSHPKVVSL